MNNIIVDTGFWYALYDPRDEYFTKANTLVDYLNIGNVIIPFPTLYETVNTRFCNRQETFNDFNVLIHRPNTIFIPDIDYKEKALELTFNQKSKKVKNYSLVDMVIRLMLDDINLNVNYLLTFNPGDFIDICLQRRIILLD